jgi:glycosyltransferase involved in cell wall biosynthesis
VKIRVCHVITRLELGGAQQNTLHTVAHLDRRRFEPSLITGPGGPLDDDARRIADVSVSFVPELVRAVSPARDARALVKLVRIFKHIAPDIVHTHSSKAGILGRWAARLAGVPAIVHTIHGHGFHTEQARVPYWIFRGLETVTGRITTRIIVVSRANLETGLRDGLFREEQTVLVRSGIPLRAFGEDVGGGSLRAELGLPPGAPVAGMVACLKAQKAPVDFVAVARRVADRISSAHFVLVGDGELRNAVEAEVDRQLLRGRFHLLGWRRDIPAILAGLNVFVLTSLWEGLPRVIPEAMASGLPVVATRVDGTPEAVADGVSGYLVPAHDVETMADRVAFILEHPGEARVMGGRAKSRVGEFDIDVMVRRQENLYEELALTTGRTGTAGLTLSASSS